jgi:uncharacterized membrane protein
VFEQLLIRATEIAVPFIDGVALLVIVIGTVEALIGALGAALVRSDGHEIRTVWLRYARWLVAGLTFQLAADIIETAIAPDWDDIGQLAAIAVIRTFLNFFLERDVADVRERQQPRPEEAPTA